MIFSIDSGCIGLTTSYQSGARLRKFVADDILLLKLRVKGKRCRRCGGEA